MQTEFFYGNYGYRTDGNVTGQPDYQPFSAETNSEVSKSQNEKAHLDIHTSNTRLDSYLFHFSSKL